MHISACSIRFSLLILFLTSFGLLPEASVFAQPHSPAASPYPNTDLLVETEQLAELMQGPDIVLIDMRDEAFMQGHIPGAVWFGGISALVDEDNDIEAFLAGPAMFQNMMRMVGVNNDSRVIIYDAGNGLGASRLFYALSLYGYENAAVLNGGFAAWKAENRRVSTEAEIPARGDFTVEYNESRACDISFITSRLENDNTVILDARAPDEYTGENLRADRGGHIPGAVNLEWRNFVQANGDFEEGIPFFKPAGELRDILAENGITRDKEVITHCQSNVRGSHAFFTLRLMGYDSVRAYEGSWYEWGNSSETPVSTP